MALTTKQLQALKPGEWGSDGSARGAGALLFRRLASKKILAYFRFTLPDGKRDTLTLGDYDEKGLSGMSLAEIRAKAGELSKLYQSGIRDLRAHFDAERLAKEAVQQALRDADNAALGRQKYTLKNLCTDYGDLLEASGKKSARQARSILKVHVLEAFPDIAALPAAEVDSDHVATLVRKVIEQGKERAAGVLRSYLSAAFNAARKARFNAKLPAHFIAYGVKNNPAEIISTIPVKRGERHLSADELKQYLAALSDDDLADQALQVAMLAGGQRMAQLLRVKIGDYDEETQTLRLWDGKGKRVTPREHLIPLAAKAAGIVENLVVRAKLQEKANAKQEGREPVYGSLWLFSSYGKIQMTETTPGKRVTAICKTMNGDPFDLRDLRRTCETMLAGMGISRDTRAQLLSHGLSGVQAAHYDRHTYTDEKRAALIAWEQRLDDIATGKQAANVVQLKRKNAP